ncbi:BID domain-containing protein (plasmid) [Aminobacter sp. BA135]|uniref:BID domain-containing protein n=1 Tax=Aminobacter sp. BA135 TaxID=537596 RepID=UPI003D7C122E
MILSRTNAKETTLDYERGTLYRQSLRFAANRGLHISRVARTLVRDRLDWVLRQKERLADLAQRFRVHGARLGLLQSPTMQIRNRAEPMVAGVTLFARSLADVVEERLLADPALAKQWEEMSTRFRYVFADPEAAFRAMEFNALLTDQRVAQHTLAQLVSEPASLGALKGRTGLLASKADKEARHVAEVNVPALKRDIERYLKLRQVAAERIEKEEQAHRHRLSIDIPRCRRR